MPAPFFPSSGLHHDNLFALLASFNSVSNVSMYCIGDSSAKRLFC